MKDMELEDIQRDQEELFDESQGYFESWYEREKAFRQKFTSQSGCGDVD